SEIKTVTASNASSGAAATWKLALWGNHRDDLALRQLQGIFSSQLGELVSDRGWSLSLGLQLRSDLGTEADPNLYEGKLHGLKLFDHRAFVDSGPKLRIQAQFLRGNSIGCYVRKRGGLGGLSLISGPRLFLWNEYASYSNEDFIIRHDKVGLA